MTLRFSAAEPPEVPDLIIGSRWHRILEALRRNGDLHHVTLRDYVAEAGKSRKANSRLTGAALKLLAEFDWVSGEHGSFFSLTEAGRAALAHARPYAYAEAA